MDNDQTLSMDQQAEMNKMLDETIEMLAELPSFTKYELVPEGKASKKKQQETLKKSKTLVKMYAGTYEQEKDEYRYSSGAHLADLDLHQKAVDQL